MLTEREAKQIVDKVVSLSKADTVEVGMSGGQRSHLRFARNTITTSGTDSNISLRITSTFQTRSGSVTVNQLDEETIRDAVRRSEKVAQLSPEDPEYMPPLGPQEYPVINDYIESTAAAGTGLMAEGAAECIRQTEAQKLVVAGFIQNRASFTAIGNSRGLFGFHISTDVSFSETVRTPEEDGSGWVTRRSNKMEDIEYGKLTGIAIDKAVKSRNPRMIEPGKYVTILEHSCVADLMRLLGFSLNGRMADEGRNFFSRPGGGNKIGEQILPENITIYSDPMDPDVPGSPWGQDGIPQHRVEWITDGVLQNLMYSRYWAEKQGREPVPFPTNIFMKGGTDSLEELIRTTKKGILVTSLWYIRSVDPRTILFTGLTRDGVFMIEDGEIAYPVMNFRWNESPIAVLRNIEAMSTAEHIPPRGVGKTVIPALRVKEFTFTSISEAI